ncbi:CHRD domain-containing protein [Sphingomonas colocasiae]|uniref:CHRD domain-containing protein n=1 Tax=Sphingomonas colocasiae TaxID=1848973 RepID=A0ABS7PKM3_9SPHN|nr:CHRD domain-containing protein [Sphingomonas colocasiae]MBY8821539.1 CHRD domain-containing protein [Sphingomonas colocasiae]
MRTMLILAAAAIVATPAIAADPVKMVTKLSGAAEVPGPGDPDGSGTATVSVNAAKGEVCYTLSVDGIDAATMAHIHKGATGVAGPPVVTLDAPAGGTSEGCKAAEAAVIAALIAAPADHYVNVHNAAFPKGAVRGQLGK